MVTTNPRLLSSHLSRCSLLPVFNQCLLSVSSVGSLMSDWGPERGAEGSEVVSPAVAADGSDRRRDMLVMAMPDPLTSRGQAGQGCVGTLACGVCCF